MAEAGLYGRGREMFGLFLIGLGVISGLALVGGAAGPVGRALSDGFGAAFGVFRYLVPPVLLWWAWTALRRREGEHAWRVGFGVVLLSLSIAGLAHLLRGPSGVDFPISDLRPAGGIVGAIVAEPLRSLVASAGAWVILLLITLFGVLVAANLDLSQMLDTAARRWEWLRTLVSGEGEPAQAKTKERSVPSSKVPGLGDTSVIDVDTGDVVLDEPEVEVEVVATADASADPDMAEAPPAPRFTMPEAPEVVPEQQAIEMMAGRARGPWKLPPLALLERSGRQDVDERMLHAGARALEAALGSHGVETRVTGMEVGPTVTRYELQLGPGVKVSRVTSLHKDIAYAMASADVRMLAPIPGRSAIGIEVPNVQRHLVALGDILASKAAVEAEHPLEVALGQDISGRAIMANLASMPHILIAGATGAGKSSCINSILTSILMRATPDQVRMILIDPKRVELGQYDRLPHLLTQVVTNPKKAANALAWAVKEMERRYDVLSEVGFRDITGYNDAVDEGQLTDATGPAGQERDYDRMPFILIVVDELSDLMMVAARDVEESITRIAQMARAVGIHLVIATQRPSVNVITGLIKANVPSRMAFAVSSQTDSRVILDQPGAERLVGKGDMLLVTASSSIAVRIQGCWVTEKEVHQVVAQWRRQSPDMTYVEGVEGADAAPQIVPGGSTGDEGDDDLLVKAMQLIVESQLGSTSMLQRKLKVGFARAGRLMDLLEQRGVVGPSHGSKARDVMMTPEELTELTNNSADA
jgi:DNA segregation ATPase FtsK/SpoIIIE, S-DNA-T family